jgi:hypothetical protein
MIGVTVALYSYLTFFGRTPRSLLMARHCLVALAVTLAMC